MSWGDMFFMSNSVSIWFNVIFTPSWRLNDAPGAREVEATGCSCRRALEIGSQDKAIQTQVGLTPEQIQLSRHSGSFLRPFVIEYCPASDGC